MNGISLQSLRMFLAVVEHGSVSAAGRELGVSQPAVSGHLHSLEERFGIVLLDRGRPMRPTRAGETLSLHARRVLDSYREMEVEMSQRSEPGGVLEVGASTTPAEVVIPKMVTEFARRYPEVNLKVRVGDTEEILSALGSREVEIAVVGLEPDSADIGSRTLQEDRLAVIVAADSDVTGISRDELASQRFVLREEGSATRKAFEAALSSSPESVMELGSNAAIIGAVAEGAGFGVVPERIAAGDDRVKSVEVEGFVLSRPLVLVNRKDRELSPAAEAFGELCVENSESEGGER